MPESSQSTHLKEVRVSQEHSVKYLRTQRIKMPCKLKLPNEQQEMRRAALPLSNSSNQEAVRGKLACFMTTYPCKDNVLSSQDARLAYKDA